MNKFERTGNPVLDKQEADSRMEFILPFVESKGFERISKRSHTVVNEENNVAIIFSSCPSNTYETGKMKEKIKSLKNDFNNIKPYIIYHRPKHEWVDKEPYINSLKAIKRLGGRWYSHKGVLCLDSIENLIENWKFFIEKNREII